MNDGVTLTFGPLPRAETLTDVLLAPATAGVTRDELSSVRSILERDVLSMTRHIDRSEPLRVDPFRVRRAVAGIRDLEQPFEWNPWTARRRLGLEAVRTSLGRPRLSPLEATRDAIDRLGRQAPEDRAPGSLGPWIAGLSLGARAVVEAEAVLWATQLLSAVVWTRAGTRLVGFDRSIVPCDAPRVIVRGRVDVELRPDSPETEKGTHAGGILVMMTGHPLPSARLELAITALAAALGDRPGVVPSRIVGYWPQSGRAVSLATDVDLLLRGCEAVASAIRAEVESSPRRLPRHKPREHHQRLPERAAS